MLTTQTMTDHFELSFRLHRVLVAACLCGAIAVPSIAQNGGGVPPSAHTRFSDTTSGGSKTSGAKISPAIETSATGDLSPSAKKISFEQASADDPKPVDPWYLTDTAGSHEISGNRSTSGSQSFYIRGASGLGSTRANLDVDLSGVSEIRLDAYLERGSVTSGDVKVNIDDKSNTVIRVENETEGTWHVDMQGDVSGYSGSHTLVLWARGDGNAAFFDDLEFYDGSGTRLSLSEVVIGVAGSRIYVDTDATGANDGSSWNDAYVHLQDALDRANRNPSVNHELWVAEGTYYPDRDDVDNNGDGSTEHSADADTSFTLTRDSVAIYGGFSGGETSRSGRDPAAHVVVLSGDITGNDDPFAPNTDTDSDGSTPEQTDHINSPNATHVMYLDGRGSANITSATVLDGLTITAGRSDEASFPQNVGGGILCDGWYEGNECSPDLTDVTVKGNHGVGGAGLFNIGAGGGRSDPTLTNVSFNGNAASSVAGAMYNDAGDGSQGGSASPTVSGGTFTNNLADYGGAIYNEATGGMGNMSVTNTTFKSNVATLAGGAIYIFSASGGTANPVISGAAFSSNSAEFGGAVYVYSDFTDTNGDPSKADPSFVNGTTFGDNVVGTSGGAIYINANNGGTATPSLDGVDFSSNDAGYGGAVYLESDSIDGGGGASVADPLIGNGTSLSTNVADHGGAVFVNANDGGTARPLFSNVTFAQNESTNQGGAVEVLGRGQDGLGNPSVAEPAFTSVWFLKNEAAYGGAVRTRTGGGGTAHPSVSNAVFSGNTASSDGGAVMNETALTLTNISAAGNSATDRGNFLSNGRGNPDLRNVVLWNASSSGAEVHVANGTPSIRYSLVDGGCPSGASCSGNLIDNDPQFAGENGGAGPDGIFGTSDDDVRLQGPGSPNGASPAIDAGDNAALDYDGDGQMELTRDFQGKSRRIDVDSVSDDGSGSSPIVDVGAYESDGSALRTGVSRPSQLSVDVHRSFGDETERTNYELVALPGAPTGSVDQTLSGSNPENWRAFREAGSLSGDGSDIIEYDGSDAFDFGPGRGFWVLADAPWSVTRDVSTVRFTNAQARAIDLHPGWNIISNPFGEDVSWDRVEQENSLSAGLWEWSGSWSEVQTFTSATDGAAYYVRNRAGLDSLLIPYPVGKNGVARATGKTTPREFRLSLRTDRTTRSTVRVGISRGATDGLDSFDRYAPPTRFQRASLHLRSDSVDAPLAADIRSGPLQRGMRYDLTLEVAPGESTILQAENLSAFGEEEVVLISQASASEYDLHREGQIEMTPKRDSSRWVLLIGDEGYVASEKKKIVPKTVQLQGNSPNPVRHSTRIEYALPEKQQVTLTIYDVLGRRVEVLVSERKSAGVHSVQWTGDHVASGVYFYRLRAGEATKTRKMVVVH